ncbi:MAG: hypothetical protein JWR16_1078 [Nevskia sp.]|nr:hypothetical protein [Nevskia sp.]
MNELDLLVAMKSYIEASEETIASLSGDDRPGIKRDVVGGMPPLYEEILRRLLRAQSATAPAAK